jgi:CBS domain-containing protein
MYQHLLALSRNNLIFQTILATEALSVSPPLGLFRDFVTESAQDASGFIDLKKSGSRLFVDSARVLALAHGVHAASTVQRLRQVARLQGHGEDDQALAEAFNFIQSLRLHHQHLETLEGRPRDNRVVPDHLNQLDRRILVEAFRQARRLQQRIKLQYQL